MIQPEPITVAGRSGVVVFLDADGQPVEPSDPEAVMAKAIFDDGGRAFYQVQPPVRLSYRERLRQFQLGGPGSGNFGHAGRPGEVGGSGSGEKKATAGTKGLTYRSPSEAQQANDIVKVAEKKDGGIVTVRKSPLDAVEQKRVFGTRDPADLVGQLIEDLPGNLSVQFAGIPEVALKLFPEGSTSAQVAVRGPGINLTRTFTRHADGTLTVHHDVFEIPEQWQGKGIAKAVLADHYQTYKEMGVDKIDMLANLDAGAYAWAKFGFKAERPSGLADVLRLRLTRAPTERRPTQAPLLKDITDTQRKNLIALIDTHKDDPRLPWHIAGAITKDGRQVGKELLHDASWFATFDMKDRETTARFEHYTQGY